MLFLLLVLSSVQVMAGDVDVPAAEQPYLLQLHGTLVRSSTGDSLEQGLWLTAAISSEQEAQYSAVLSRNFYYEAYRLVALSANKELLSETAFTVRGSSGEIKVDLVLPTATAYVELRAADGSLVANGVQSWPQKEQAPLLSYMETTVLDASARKLRLRWVPEAICDGYTVWYTADGMVWYCLAQTEETTAVVELGDLPGGQLEGDKAEMRVLASKGLTTDGRSQRIEVAWLIPEVQIRNLKAGAILKFDREETIELEATAWDPQECWMIIDRLIWIDDRSNILATGSDLLLPASRFPVGHYSLTALTMNSQGLFGGQEIQLRISARMDTSSAADAAYVDEQGKLILPLRRVMEAAGWGVIYDSVRHEIKINGYHVTYTIQANGDLWQNGFFLGQLQLIIREGQNWISAEDMELLGFEYPTWNEEEQVLTIAPK